MSIDAEVDLSRINIEAVGVGGPRGQQGVQGPQGETGPAGPANTLTIGTVQEGETAAATITGDSPSQVLNLVLPKGEKGDTGEKGEMGAQGAKGDKGDKGEAGEKGEKGDRGPQGTTNYIDMDNKPSINNVTLEGDKTSEDLGLQPAGDYATRSDIPTELSDLENDKGFITKTVSGLTNYYDKDVVDEKLADKQDKLIAGDGISIDDDNVITNTRLTAAWGNITGDIANQTDLKGQLDDLDDRTTANSGDISSLQANKQDAISSSNKLNADFVDDTSTTHKFATANQLNQISTNETNIGDLQSSKQNITDNSLNTTSKTVSGAINEVNGIAKGANQALSYADYQTMVAAFNAASATAFNVGQNIYIVTVDVPDLWVSSIETTAVAYEYTTDAAFISALETNHYVQVGYYKLSALETQEVDLTDYVKNTDYATSSTGGVVKSGSGFLVNSSGAPSASIWSYSTYTSNANSVFIGKGTLENVITGKGLVSNTDYASSSTGGVIKTSGTYATTIGSGGELTAQTKQYSSYDSMSNSAFISKGTLENAITGKGLVSDTDYATSAKGGVVKTGSQLGILINANGNPYIDYAVNDDISSKTSYRKPIVPATLDYAVKVGVTTNANTLTDTEKTNACAWLGTGKMTTISQADYDALVSGGTVDTNTYYFIPED